MAIKLEHSTSANCSVESVWRVFAETTQWPQWSGLFSRATWIEGEPWAKGSALLLEVSQPAAKVRATVAESEAHAHAKWKGDVMGVSIQHDFRFMPQTDGTTLMKSAIELSGPATFFISDNMKKKGLQTFVEWFDAMRLQAERMSVAETPKKV